MFTAKVSGKSKSATLKIAVTLLAMLFLAIPGTGLLSIDLSQASGGGWDDDRDDDHDNRWKRPKFCSQSAGVVFLACGSEVADDFLIATTNCINVSDPGEREECRAEAREEKKEAKELCKEQLEARLEVCDLVGEKRYDPDFSRGNFVEDPINDPDPGNTYFPLKVGNTWVYEGGGERITVEVLSATKLIEGVTCIVVNDVVEEDGEVIEDTDDWYAQHKDTDDVWYCGEIAQNFETFEGDVPEDPELVDIEGSWKAGVDGAKPGILIQAEPEEGNAYRQEVLWGNAEDVAEVLSNNYVYGGHSDDPDSLDYLVPAVLARLLCSDGDCVVTRDLTALEPGVEERKYYAPGIGVFLEVNLEAEEIVQLVECNSDPKCLDLSTP